VYGKTTAATPDGRKAGDPLSDGISPVQALDRNGPEAILLSSAKLHQEKFSDGTLLNMKFHPTTLNTPGSVKKLSELIKTYFEMGGIDKKM
jgi:formate C-acetyltransferase